MNVRGLNRHYYANAIDAFCSQGTDEIVGAIAIANSFPLTVEQRDAWVEQIAILKEAFARLAVTGHLYFEYSIPRLGRRVDAVVLAGGVLFVIEFKVGEAGYPAHAVDQVCDYALDLKNFHEPSHGLVIAPILVATEAPADPKGQEVVLHGDRLLEPLRCNRETLAAGMRKILEHARGPEIIAADWETGRYCPTPTIIEAATALYRGHSVVEISRSDAGAKNLTSTTRTIAEIIQAAREQSHKAICFVTGVPGAGKTLVGLDVATTHIDKEDALHSVFLSGNGPLVKILREALTRDKVQSEREQGRTIKKGQAASEVKMFIQDVHHFRDDCLRDKERPPIEHVAIFDEAQRAWNLEQTASFMKRKKGIAEFPHSEPEFLISSLDRHPDWAVIVCLVGGGQEINTGEAGIGEWLASVERAFPHWRVYVSPHLTDSEYAAAEQIEAIRPKLFVSLKEDLHLSVSMRSFRSENVSRLVKQILDLDQAGAQRTLEEVQERFPIVLTRDLSRAKAWLRAQARGSERYGIVVSSEAQRLKPHAIDVRTVVDPVHWFLGGRDDVRSSYYLEDVVTEFQVQGLELDWTCVTWDADFRRTGAGWGHWSFCGNKWQRIKKEERQAHQKNAYRVLLTRARQGMVVVVPEGEAGDATRSPAYYDETFEYLSRVGFSVL